MSGENAKTRGAVLAVPISEVVPSRWQYRRRFDAGSLAELASSIKRHGLVNAILVFGLGDGGGYELIAGERRLRAASALGLVKAHPGLDLPAAVTITSAAGWWDGDPYLEILAKSRATIRAEVREGAAEDWQEIAVIENLQRENPTAIEEAAAYAALIAANGWTQSELARHLGKSEGFVSQRLSLGDLTDAAKEATHAGSIPFASARAIAKVPGPVQEAVTAQVVNKMASSEPATTRQVAAFTGQVRRFLDPERWRPADGEVISAGERNRYNLLRWHVRDLLAKKADRAGEVVLELQNVKGTKYLGKKASTITDQKYSTAEVLTVLTGAGHSAYNGIGPWWRAFAQAKGYTCDRCRWSGVEVPAGKVKGAQCRRAEQGEAKRGGIVTCELYVDPDEPVAMFVRWDDREVLSEHAPDLTQHGESGRGDLPYLGSVGDHLKARIVINRIEDAEREARTRAKSEGYLEPMRQFWQAQPRGAGPGLLLVHGLAQGCRGCRFYRPEHSLEGEPEVPPCAFAVEPLKAGPYVNAANRAPNYAVLVNKGGVSVPRCEVYQAAEMPTFARVGGLTFPSTKAGRAVVIGWLRRITFSDYAGRDHDGATPGFLAWVPYNRDPGTTWDRDLLCRHVRDHWDDFGDAGVAHLLTSAALEAKAKGSHGPYAIELRDPATGTVEKWAAVAFERWAAGEVPNYGYPNGWPMPWVKAGEGAGDGAGDDAG